MKDLINHIGEAALPRNLNANAPGFDDAFAALLDSKRENDSDVSDTVAAIIADVIARGDGALIDLSRRFDNIDLAATGIAISAGEISKARSACAAKWWRIGKGRRTD